MESELGIWFVSQIPFQLHLLYLLQVACVGYLLSRAMKFLKCPRMRRRKARRDRNFTPPQRVERMFRFSFDDLSLSLSESDLTTNKVTLFNTVRNIHVSAEGLPERLTEPKLKKKKSVRFNPEADTIHDRMVTPEAFKYPAEWASVGAAPALWPDIDTFLGSS